MTHFWVEGKPLRVIMDEIGDPVQLIFEGETHTVVQIANHWIVDEDWWLDHIYRDYYKVATDTMMLLTVFCDMNTEEWFIQRLYD